jgi:hypothetical protein
MLNPTVFSQLPLASADSTNVAQNHGRERKRYALTAAMGALAIVDRIEHHASAPRWTRTYGTRNEPRPGRMTDASRAGVVVD